MFSTHESATPKSQTVQHSVLPAGTTLNGDLIGSGDITIVDDVSDVEGMQAGYNRRVNEYLQGQGVIDEPRTNWHNQLDVDFMDDPRELTYAEFRAIAVANPLRDFLEDVELVEA